MLADNDLTVIFAIFMSIWAVFFTKFWNRKCAKLTHRLINIFFIAKKGNSVSYSY